MYARNEKIVPIFIEDEMKDSYISYAMSVIVGRALPDVRDGLKPVHRRILYGMRELGLEHTKPYKKSARIVGEVLGKYHPHGDVAVYDTLVRMVQDFSLRYPLIEGQGNFGSVDGDAPAAMRYTEARMAAITDEMLSDLEKDTVDFMPNFDASLEEPKVLPATLPNLLINGSSGIAVGMATNIPPHNLSEVADGVTALIDDSDASLKDLMKIIKAPDFPTGGIICGREGIKQAYTTGRGLIKVRARAGVESQKSGKESIIITEIPYQVNKANLIEAIAQLVQDKKVEGISDIRDESDKDGLRVVIELKRDANAQVILNQLFKHTQLEVSFGIIMLALVENRPRVLNLKQVLEYYIEHRKEVVTRRTKFDLARAKERAHILEGLKKALANLDKIIELIKKSKSEPEARESLIKKFDFSEIQAQAILEMQLRRLTALEREKLEAEYLELIKKIELYESILKSEKKVLQIIKEEVLKIKEKYGDERLTDIVGEVEDLEVEDLIAEEDVVITISHAGYIKRLPVSTYRRQARGGRGKSGQTTRETDFLEHLFIASTHDYILFFTARGQLHWLKVYEIPQAGRTAQGKAIVNLIQIDKEDRVAAMLPVRTFDDQHFVTIATRKGTIKKTSLSAFSNPRRVGIRAITIPEDDEVIEAKITDGSHDVILATRHGQSIRFPEEKVRAMGRVAYGVRGIRLSSGDYVIGMVTTNREATLLVVSEKGLGKRSAVSDYRVTNRGGKGIITLRCTPKTGELVSIKDVVDEDEIILITQQGLIIRIPLSSVKVIGRNTSGVKLINLNEGDRLVDVARIVPGEDSDQEDEFVDEGNGAEEGAE